MQAKSLTDAMKDFREALGLGQVEFGVRFRKSYSTIQRYEGGATPPPEYLALLALDALDQQRLEFAIIFREAALKDIAPEIVKLIQEGSQSNEPSREKAATQSAVHKARRTSSR